MTTNIRDKARKILCYCPICEKDYYRVMHWTGRGKPRKFCPLHTEKGIDECGLTSPDEEYTYHKPN
jgi:hypothetical protein